LQFPDAVAQGNGFNLENLSLDLEIHAEMVMTLYRFSSRLSHYLLLQHRSLSPIHATPCSVKT
jgi:hypothetical protein